MRIFYQLQGLFRALFHSRRIDADLADEMQFHLERETQANVARGMSRTVAYRTARLKFGSVDAAQELSRDDRPGAGVRQTVRDVRFGARLLAKSPVFGLTGIAVVALGVGAATAVFGVVYGVMLRPLPFHEPDRLVTIWLARPSGRTYPSAADAAALRELSDVFKDVALVRSSNANLSLTGNGEPQRLQAARVSTNMFSVLGVNPNFGRAFIVGEDQPGRANVVILSDAMWRSRFGAEPRIIGRQLQLNGVAHTVVGVMPSEFQFPATGLDAWTPAVLEPGELARTTINNYRLVARLQPNVPIAQARVATAALARRLGNSYRWNADASFEIDSMLDDAVAPVRPALRLLLGAVSFLLLIACVNLSNLFSARATARGSEFAVRLALGASRARLVAQAVAESLPILAIGGMLGIALAQWAVRAFVASAPAGLPRVETIALSGPVIAYSLALLTITGIAASIAPATQAWRLDFTAITKAVSRSSTAGRGRARARRMGVAAQIAFALPLLVGASLLMRSAMALERVQPGFNPTGVTTLAFEVSRTRHQTDKDAAAYYAQLVGAVHAVPGVQAVAIANRIPLSGAQTNPVHFETPAVGDDDETNVDSRTVTPEYFGAMGIPVIAGRTFTDHDDASSPQVAIVDARIAQTMWPGENVVGKRFRGPNGEGTIIGVVGHVHTAGLDVDPRPQMYWSVRQWTQTRAVMAVRSEGDGTTLPAAIIRAIHSVEPEQAVFDIRTMQQVVDASLAQRRLTTVLMIGFSAVALALAGIGTYGVVAYGVAQRQREFGIRIALGARARQVMGLVMWQGASMAMLGCVVGLVLAAAAAGLMSNLVYDVAPRDVVNLFGAAIVLVAVTVLASAIPARRAARVDPSAMLRME
jgi:putative ABC transport system permease protein